MNKNGRPKSEKTRDKRFNVRMSKADTDMLDEISKNTGRTKAEIVREAVKMRYDLMKTCGQK